jgi:hypothetical protein
MKYIYSPQHQGLVEAPLMEKPDEKCEMYWRPDFKRRRHGQIFLKLTYNADLAAYNTWLSSPPIYKVRPEDIEWFSIERGEDEFEDVWYNFGGFDKPDDYGPLAIPKKGNESKEQSHSVDLDQVVYVPTSELPEKDGRYVVDGMYETLSDARFENGKWYENCMEITEYVKTWLKKTTIRELIQPTL